MCLPVLSSPELPSSTDPSQGGSDRSNSPSPVQPQIRGRDCSRIPLPKEEDRDDRSIERKKFLFVVAVAAAIALATIFSGGIATGLILSGAAIWKIILAVTASVSLFISFSSSLYLADKNKMYQKTGNDSKNISGFVTDTLCSFPFFIPWTVRSFLDQK